MADDQTLTVAMLGRLPHHAHIVQISGGSYRFKEGRKAGPEYTPQIAEVLDTHLSGNLDQARRSPALGCNATTTNARMSRSATCHQASIASSASGKPLLTDALLDGEGYVAAPDSMT